MAKQLGFSSTNVSEPAHFSFNLASVVCPPPIINIFAPGCDPAAIQAEDSRDIGACAGRRSRPGRHVGAERACRSRRPRSTGWRQLQLRRGGGTFKFLVFVFVSKLFKFWGQTRPIQEETERSPCQSCASGPSQESQGLQDQGRQACRQPEAEAETCSQRQGSWQSQGQADSCCFDREYLGWLAVILLFFRPTHASSKVACARSPMQENSPSTPAMWFSTVALQTSSSRKPHPRPPHRPNGPRRPSEHEKQCKTVCLALCMHAASTATVSKETSRRSVDEALFPRSHQNRRSCHLKSHIERALIYARKLGVMRGCIVKSL